MQKKFQQVEIGLASPYKIINSIERLLPNGEIVGEVTSWETVNYKTLKPEPNGLFCQRIFGPVVDYSCACGKKSAKNSLGFCFKCGVERTSARVRRYRLGYITLKQPMVHTLYAAHKPSPLSLCLDWSNKRIQAIMYGTEFCYLPSIFKVFAFRRKMYRRNFLKVKSKKKEFLGNPKKEFEQRISFYTENKKPKIHKERKTLVLKNASFSDNQDTFFETFLKSRKKVVKSKTPKLFRTTSKFKPRIKSEASFVAYYEKIITVLLWRHIRQSKVGYESVPDFFSYAICYDATWRHVQNFQDFLVYSWEQPKSYERVLAYYTLRRGLRRSNPIPRYHEIVSGKMESRFSTDLNILYNPLYDETYPIQTGGFVFQKIFSYFPLKRILRQFQFHHYKVNWYIRYLQEKLKWYPPNPSEILMDEIKRIVKKRTRLKKYEKKYVKSGHYFRDFYTKDMSPAWMVLNYLPVLPPGLRPIMSIQGELIVSDINSLYRKVLTRNKRIQSITKFQIFDPALSGSWESWCYNLRQVQEAIDSLLKTGSVDSGKITKSLLDSLKGKKGRFRQHLLGKRVDYSGRSVIVVGPTLKIYECGLPKQMAIELFQPFLIQKLRTQGISSTTIYAKTLISQKHPIIWSFLAEILKNHPILLNRAPTLHRLGIQAFLPRLVEGKAILLHPLVCPAFNADFDGDQMAVHIPLAAAARSEAFHLMWSRNHLLAPASGDPLLLPTQDMVLGCYYLTIFKNSKSKQYKNTRDFLYSEFSPYPSSKQEKSHQKPNVSGYYFSTLNEIEQALDQKQVETHTPIWMRWFGVLQNFVSEQDAKSLEQPLEFRIDMYGKSDYVFHDREVKKQKEFSESFLKTPSFQNLVYIRTTPGRVVFHTKFPLPFRREKFVQQITPAQKE